MAMTRSRLGCTTCRQRKKKCDQIRPECGQCSQRGVQCGGYVSRITWSNAIATRGYLAGKTTPAEPAAPAASISAPKLPSPTSITSISPLSHVPIPAGQGARLYMSPGAESIGGDTHISPGHSSAIDTAGSTVSITSPVTDLSLWSSNSPGLSPGHVSDDAANNATLADFFAHGIHTLTANGAYGAFLAELKDLVVEHQALRLVCIVLQRCISEGPTVTVLEQTGWLLKMFRNMTNSGISEQRHILFTTGFLICSLHLIQALPWTPTFYNLLDVFSPSADLALIRPNPEYHLSVRHQIETFSLLDMSTVVLGRIMPSRGLWAKFRALQANWDERFDAPTEATTGLPRTLLDLLADQPQKSHEEVEGALLAWSGPAGDMLSEYLLWESYRNARILSIRHERELQSPRTTTLSSDAVPTEVIVFRLLGSLKAILSDANWPPGRALQAQHVALYPLVYASIQITTLQNRPDWRDDLRRMRAQVVSLEHTASKNNKVLFEMLDEAEQSGADGYDLDQAARRHGVEITII